MVKKEYNNPREKNTTNYNSMETDTIACQNTKIVTTMQLLK